MLKLTVAELIRRKIVLPASELKVQKDTEALALKDFENAANEQGRNQRFQSPKATGSITKPYKRESFD